MADIAAAGNCLNCGAALQGRFCAACGQKATSTRLAFNHVVHEVIHEFLHLDGKIFTTIKTLVASPGRLTTEFLEGRRASYISPLRVYLTFSLLFFIVSALVPGGQASFFNVTVTDEQTSGWTLKMSDPAAAASQSGRAVDPETRDRAAGSFMSNVSRAVFVLMPAAALVTFAFFRRREPYFVSHLYYSVHLHAFAFLAFTAAVLVARLGAGHIAADVLSAAAVASVAPYHFVALRRVFKESWGRTIWKGAAVTLLYLALLAVVIGIVMAVTIAGLGSVG